MTIQSRLRYARRLLLLAGAALALTAGALAGAGTGVPVARAASSLPCDIYAAADALRRVQHHAGAVRLL